MDKFVLYFYLIDMYFLIKIKVLILVKKTLISFLLTVYLMGFSSRWRDKMFWFDMKPKPFAKDRNAMELKKMRPPCCRLKFANLPSPEIQTTITLRF